MRIVRAAGIQHASVATPASRMTTPQIVAGSCAVTPYSMLAITLESTNATTMPANSLRMTGVIPCRKTSQLTCSGRAPNARRTPNSVRRCATAYETNPYTPRLARSIPILPNVKRASDSNERASLRHSKKMHGVYPQPTRVMRTAALFRDRDKLAWCTERERRNSTPFTTLKMAVFAPTPRANVATATAVNPGPRRSMRSEREKSCPKLISASRIADVLPGNEPEIA